MVFRLSSARPTNPRHSFLNRTQSLACVVFWPSQPLRLRVAPLPSWVVTAKADSPRGIHLTDKYGAPSIPLYTLLSQVVDPVIALRDSGSSPASSPPSVIVFSPSSWSSWFGSRVPIHISSWRICFVCLLHHQIPPGVCYPPLFRTVSHHHRCKIKRRRQPLHAYIHVKLVPPQVKPAIQESVNFVWRHDVLLPEKPLAINSMHHRPEPRFPCRFVFPVVRVWPIPPAPVDALFPRSLLIGVFQVDLNYCPADG